MRGSSSTAIISRSAPQMLVRTVRADHEEDLLGRSFHVTPPHGRDVIHSTMMNGKDEQRELDAGGAEPLVGPADAVPREPDPGRGRPDVHVWRIKSQGNGEARQQFLDGYTCRRSGSSG